MKLPRGALTSSASRARTCSRRCTHVARFEHAEVESRPSAAREQRRHARLVHPNADAIAGDARLRHLEQGAADPIAIADAHRSVWQSFDGEVLAELAVDEVAPFQLLFPVAVGIDLVDVDRAVHAAVAGQVALPIALDIQPVDAAAARHRILPDRGMHRATLPRDVARESDVYREQSRHVGPRCCALLIVNTLPTRPGNGQALREHAAMGGDRIVRALRLFAYDPPGTAQL
jgi:hypothetical protein